MSGRQRTSVPSVFRLPSGSYQAVFRADGRQRSRSFATLREARAFLAQTQADLARGSWVDPAGGRVRFGDWVAAWLETRRVRASTAARTSWALEHYLLPRFGDRPLGAITPREVKVWVGDLEDAGLSRASVEKLYHLLAQIMAEATDEDLIGRSPCRGVKFSEWAPAAREARALTGAEAARLLEAIRRGPGSAATGTSSSPRRNADDEPRLGAYTLVLFLLGSGCRWGEAAGLRRRRVQLLHRPPAVEIAETLHEVNGRLSHGPPKTRSSVRTIPLPQTVAQALAAHLPANGDPEDLVFTTRRGSPLRRTNFASATWWPAVRAAGLEGVRVHDLRSSYASVLENHGVPRAVTAELLGHVGSGSITAGYTKAWQQTINEAVEVVNAWLAEALGGSAYTSGTGDAP